MQEKKFKNFKSRLFPLENSYKIPIPRPKPEVEVQPTPEVAAEPASEVATESTKSTKSKAKTKRQTPKLKLHQDYGFS